MEWLGTATKIVGGLFIGGAGLICVVVFLVVVITIISVIYKKVKGSNAVKKIIKKETTTTTVTTDSSKAKTSEHLNDVFQSLQVVQDDAIIRKDEEAKKAADTLLVHLLGSDAVASLTQKVSNGNKSVTPVSEIKE